MSLTNEHGLKFLKEVREIYGDCNRLSTAGHAARVTAFSICVMLDGYGEHCGPDYELYVRTESGKLEPVRFWHSEL